MCRGFESLLRYQLNCLISFYFLAVLGGIARTILPALCNPCVGVPTILFAVSSGTGRPMAAIPLSIWVP